MIKKSSRTKAKFFLDPLKLQKFVFLSKCNALKFLNSFKLSFIFIFNGFEIEHSKPTKISVITIKFSFRSKKWSGTSKGEGNEFPEITEIRPTRPIKKDFIGKLRWFFFFESVHRFSSLISSTEKLILWVQYYFEMYKYLQKFKIPSHSI